jgi:hypothetical protein
VFGSTCILAFLDQPPASAKRIRSSDLFVEQNTVPGGYIRRTNLALDLISGTVLQHTPPKPLAEVNLSVDQILQRYRPAMQNLVKEAGRRPFLPIWIPRTRSDDTDTAFRDHIKRLAIPAVQGRPSLILHDLGSETSAISQKQAEYIDDIFSLDCHTCVGNYDSMHFAD